MKGYVHARLGEQESHLLEKLIEYTGETESSLVKKGLKLIYEKEVKQARSALDVAGKSVGLFSSKFTDLSYNKKHLQGYGK